MPPETPRLCRDPDDDKVIAVAIYGLADYIVTVDQDLLYVEVVKHLEEWGIDVKSGDELVRLLAARPVAWTELRHAILSRRLRAYDPTDAVRAVYAWDSTT